MGNTFLIIDASMENSKHEMVKAYWVIVNLFAALQEKKFTF